MPIDETSRKNIAQRFTNYYPEKYSMIWCMLNTTSEHKENLKRMVNIKGGFLGDLFNFYEEISDEIKSEINEPNFLGELLLLSSEFGPTENAEFLLSKGADVTYTYSKEGVVSEYAVLHAAATHGSPKMIQILAEAGAKMTKTGKGKSPLNYALEWAKPGAFNELVKIYKEDAIRLINEQNEEGDTLLHLMVKSFNNCYYENIDARKTLLAYLLYLGSNTDIANKEGKTSRDLISDIKKINYGLDQFYIIEKGKTPSEVVSKLSTEVKEIFENPVSFLPRYMKCDIDSFMVTAHYGAEEVHEVVADEEVDMIGDGSCYEDAGE